MQFAAPNLQPTLIGESVSIRPLRPEDWPEMFAAASDPLIWEIHLLGTASRRPFSESSSMVRLRQTAHSPSPRTCNGFDHRFKPLPWLRPRIERNRDRVDVPRSQTLGGTTNREIKHLMLDHAFTFVDTVVFWVGEANWRSQRAMEKIGGIRREGSFSRPAVAGPHAVFEITKDGFIQIAALRSSCNRSWFKK